MHVVVVGCGRVGSGLAMSLTRDGHSVSIIDKRAAAFRRLPADWEGDTVTGFGFDRDHLEQAGIRRANAFAAVTSGDNSNILSARIARETYEIENVVARIYDPRRALIYQRLGIPTVATVTWTTEQVLRRLFPEVSTTEWTTPSGDVSLIERSLPPAWAGRRIVDLDLEGRIKVVALTRADQARIVSPDLVGQEADLLHVVVHRGAAEELERRLSHQPAPGEKR